MPSIECHFIVHVMNFMAVIFVMRDTLCLQTVKNRDLLCEIWGRAGGWSGACVCACVWGWLSGCTPEIKGVPGNVLRILLGLAAEIQPLFSQISPNCGATDRPGSFQSVSLFSPSFMMLSVYCLFAG